MSFPRSRSRYKFLLNLILAAQLVSGKPQMRGGRQEWDGGQEWVAASPPGNNPSYPTQPDEQTPPEYPTQPDESPPPNPPYVGNLSILPSSTINSDCHVCTISVSSISLYYWPVESTNTACLATIPPQPSPTYPPDLNPIWPSVYAVFISVTVNNVCGFTVSYPSSTASFDKDALKTLDGSGKMQSFDLADLPCPPASVTLEPGQPYKPWFAWNKELFFKQNAEPQQCKAIAGLNAWLDPPMALTSVTGDLLAPTAELPPRARLKRDPTVAHVAPRVPAMTTPAT